MKCNEIRNLALAYLDSELDAKTSQEIQLHLKTCPECAQIFEQEEEFNERLFGVLSAGRLTLALWEKIESHLRPKRYSAWLFPQWRKFAVAGLGILLVAGMAAGGFMVYRSRLPSLDLAEAVEKDHREVVEGKMTPQFAGALPKEIAKEMGERLDAAAFNAVPAATGFHADGARLCHLKGVPVAWLMGRCDGVPVSLVVFNKKELEHFPKTLQRLETGEPIVCTRTGRFQFAVRLADGHVICAIADTPKITLEELLKSVADPG
jgi:anti-sigma factor RsiW